VAKKKELSFAEARSRLDEILAEVESDAGDVDQLAAKVREAAELIRFCRDRLAAARHEVTQVVADLSALEQSVAAEASSQGAGAPDEDEDEDDADDEDDGAAEAGGGRLPF
jgi:exodeoxyribonuclease VII small subunit